MSDGRGIPLAALQTAANANEGTVLARLVDGIPPIKRPRGGRRRRPPKLHADKAYAARANRRMPSGGATSPRGSPAPDRLQT